MSFLVLDMSDLGIGLLDSGLEAILSIKTQAILNKVYIIYKEFYFIVKHLICTFLVFDVR